MAKSKGNKKAGNGKLSRLDAANAAVLAFTGQTTLSELAKAADDAVVAAGGTSNLDQQRWFIKRSLRTAAAFGMVSLTRPTEIIVTKAGA